MKTILVTAGGSNTDHPVFETALLAARPLGAHLDFLHLRIGAAAAAENMPHIEFARGAALRECLDWLKRNAETRSAAAAEHVHQFCARHHIPMRDVPGEAGISASWREETAETMRHLLRRARHSDAIVLGRPTQANGLPSDLLEELLLGCGRPLLVAPPRAPERLTGTLMVCWRETAESARAVTAALPLLAQARHVMVVAVEDGDNTEPEAAADIARQLAWHGIRAEGRWLAGDGRPVAARLEASAAAIDADLLVLGGYGHSRTREAIFGGCTRHFLERSERALLLVH